MNIAFFSKQLPSDRPAGVSVQVDRLARALCSRDHSVTCFSFSSRPENAPYKVVRLSWGSESRFKRKFIPASTFQTVDKSGFDILHFHGDDYLCAGGPNRVRTFYGSALFEALHAKSPGRFFYQSLFYLLELASCCRRGVRVSISDATRRALPFVQHVIPCSVPLDIYTPDPRSRSSAPSILFIGDFKSRKRGNLLLRAFANEVLPRFPECRLTIVGPDKTDARNVRCLGSIDEAELVREYRKAWIYCMPSSYEGFGVPAIEAMACGTAVVAARNSGIEEVLENGKNGLVCSGAALGSSIVALLENTTLRNTLVAGGLTTAMRFDLRTIAAQYEELYQAARSTHMSD